MTRAERLRAVAGLLQVSIGIEPEDLDDAYRMITDDMGECCEDLQEEIIKALLQLADVEEQKRAPHLENLYQEVDAELQRATKKFPVWPTDPLHALAIVGEEFGELNKEMLQLTYEPHKTDKNKIRSEAIQTAAMALRLSMSLDTYEYKPSRQHFQLGQPPYPSCHESTKGTVLGKDIPVREGVVISDVSDGYHSFRELYDFRKMYNAALFNEWALQGKYQVHKSLCHHDGTPCFDGLYFIVSAKLEGGPISNHYKLEDWNLFTIPETATALFEYDGHNGQDVLQRLRETLTK